MTSHHSGVPSRWTGSAFTPNLDLWLEHNGSATALRTFGDLDAETTPQLDELLARELRSAAEVLVVDLSRATFVSMEALYVLTEAHEQAHAHGLTLRLVIGPPCVERALRAADLLGTFECYYALAPAMADPVRPVSTS
jgi:anti-anti-sigma factor